MSSHTVDFENYQHSMNRTILLTVGFFVVLISCNHSNGNRESALTRKDSVVSITPKISPTREIVKKNAVVSYSEKTENPLNDWYFKVELYETNNTFHYLVKLQYEEIRGTDTLKLPNFGRIPELVIKKGEEQYSCIIGFLDKENKFREYKKVYVKDNVLKVTTIRHYSVRVVPGKSD